MDERRKAIFVAFHDLHSGHHLRQAGRALSPETAGAPSTAPWTRSRSSSTSAAPARAPTSSAISSTRATPATSSPTTSCSIRFSGSAARSLSATSRAAGGALYLLYTHDDQRQQLIDDPSLIPEAIEECLRLGSNGYFTFPRIATKDTEVGGTRILKGMVVRPSPLAPNYDPDVFPDPLRFDIHRKPKRILSFGAGPHHCVGNILGRTTITTAITRLLARFPKAHMIDPDFTPVYGGAVGELRLQSLPMRIH